MLRIQVIRAILAGAGAVSSPAVAQDSTRAAPDPVAQLVARLDLERYKATIKGLTQFGDRRQGTARNRAAVDWIEQQLRSYGCSDVTRLTYDFSPPSPEGAALSAAKGRGGQGGGAPGGGGGEDGGARG